MSRNISKEKRDNLIEKIKEIKAFLIDRDTTGKIRGYVNELENELTKQKFGLLFEEHREEIEDKLETHTPILEEDKNLFVDNGGQINFLIEGDNLASLKLLEKTHKGKIDVIYIDPPYNTGSKDDFCYSDKFVDTNDSFRHSKWLSFMQVRLNIAYGLLSKKGIIFISIGEQEIAQLTLLCDKIFDRYNFLSIISRISKTASDKGSHFAPSCDYIVCYAKYKDSIDTSNFYDSVNEELYTKEDSDGRKYRDDIAFYQSSLDPLRGCTNQRYFVECPDGTLVIPPGDQMPNVKGDGEKVLPISKNDKVWRWSQETYMQKKKLLVFKETKTSPLLDQNGFKAKYNVYTKSYLDIRELKGVKPRNFLVDKKFLNRRGQDYLKKLGIFFSYSKPKELIEHLLNISHPPKGAIILDFFAGSGTTGEAVLDMKEKEYKFILCTNNENDICREITYERIKRVIERENFQVSLKYMKVDYIDTQNQLYYEYANKLLLHIKELVELENAINFTENLEFAIILTEEELNNFFETRKINCCKKIYLGHDVLPNSDQEKVFMDNKIEIVIIPDYYYKELRS